MKTDKVTTAEAVKWWESLDDISRQYYSDKHSQDIPVLITTSGEYSDRLKRKHRKMITDLYLSEVRSLANDSELVVIGYCNDDILTKAKLRAHGCYVTTNYQTNRKEVLVWDKVSTHTQHLLLTKGLIQSN